MKVSCRNRNANTNKAPNWEYRFEGARVNGKRKQISKSGFLTKKAAYDAGLKAYNLYQNGNIINESNISYHDFLDMWYKNEVCMNLKLSTQQSYNNVINNYLKKDIGYYKLKSLNYTLLQEYINKLSQTLAKSSLNTVIVVIKTSLKYALCQMNYISSNPAIYLKNPLKTENSEKVIISVQDWNNIKDYLKVNKALTCYMLSFYTGMRESEALALTWNDVDFVNNTISISKTLTRKINQKITFQTPKTKGSTRIIKISNDLINYLKELKEFQENKENISKGYYTCSYLIDGYIEQHAKLEKIDNKKRIYFINIDEYGDKVAVDYIMHKAKEISNFIPGFTFHSLRHTHATMLLEGGANIKDIQTRLGHTNIQTTLNVYSHSTEQIQNNTLTIFDNLIK